MLAPAAPCSQCAETGHASSRALAARLQTIGSKRKSLAQRPGSCIVAVAATPTRLLLQASSSSNGRPPLVAAFDGRRSSWRTIASIAVTVPSRLALRRRRATLRRACASRWRASGGCLARAGGASGFHATGQSRRGGVGAGETPRYGPRGRRGMSLLVIDSDVARFAIDVRGVPGGWDPRARALKPAPLRELVAAECDRRLAAAVA